jgi:REP element-mobilizing transposase RayT
VAHVRRLALDGRTVPVHVTLRVVRGVRFLRGFKVYPVVRRALVAASARFGARIVHFSVQGDHIHLLVEARDRGCLARAMKGFEVRVARRLNALMGRRGRVFADRYHVHHLETPREARNALVYVLGNRAKHAGAGERGRTAESTWIDPFSSACYFGGWAARPGRMPARDAPGHPLHDEEAQRGPVVADAATWMLRAGWRRAGGAISPWERPRT